ncbi:MAG: SPASM domain-containing protein [Euryarchaeota archaeon]|nr:SPASM domain-containing protein [Euryarchaeota archaeon]
MTKTNKRAAFIPATSNGVFCRVSIKNQDDLDEAVNKLHKIKAMDTKLISISHVALEYTKRYFKDPKREDIPCYLGYLRIYLCPQGEMYSSCWALPPAGNLRKKTVEEIINSENYKKRLYEMFMKKCPGCACGYALHLWYHFPSICNEIKWHLKMVRLGGSRESQWCHHITPRNLMNTIVN